MGSLGQQRPGERWGAGTYRGQGAGPPAGHQGGKAKVRTESGGRVRELCRPTCQLVTCRWDHTHEILPRFSQVCPPP